MISEANIKGIYYKGIDEDFSRRVQDRINLGTPLPHQDDETLESFFLFEALNANQKEKVKAEKDPIKKKKKIVQFLKENGLS